MIRATAAADCALALRAQGFVPDLIIGHPGWGETLFLREIFPRAKMILHGEFYYRAKGADVGFDPEFAAADPGRPYVAAAKNATMALAYVEADHIVCPTPFQASLFPAALRARASVIHEGVDTAAARRRLDARLHLKDGRVLDGSSPVITFINRRFEPLRGFHVFMRALPKVLAAVPDAQAVLIGSDHNAGYGARAPDGTTWKQVLLSEVGPKLDLSRVHFVGRLTYEDVVAALSLSAAHVYYTYPFVLSWSLLDAMACECAVFASDTAPVRDVVEDGVTGRLLDFFDVGALSDHLIEACRAGARFQPWRLAARSAVVSRFDRKSVCLPAWLRLIDGV